MEETRVLLHDDLSVRKEDGEFVLHIPNSAPTDVVTDRKHQGWVQSIQHKIYAEPRLLRALTVSPPCSIHRFPKSFQFHGEENFEPRAISIGPYYYHKRANELRAMEEHKWQCLRKISDEKGDDFLESCYSSVQERELEARRCYSQEIDLDSNLFVEMLVLDACFIIEFVRRALLFFDSDDIGNCVGGDPYVVLSCLQWVIITDLLLLENQIPLFILTHLYHLINGPHHQPTSFVKSALPLFSRSWAFLNILIKPNMSSILDDSLLKICSRICAEAQHLLHLLHFFCIPTSRDRYPQSSYEYKEIQTASEIEEAGIECKKRNGGEDIFDVKFENGVLEIPHWFIDNISYNILLNLIVFEQCYVFCDSYFSGYIHFMDRLINTEKDVEILRKKGIINHCLGNNEDVATIFNKLAKNVNYIPDCFHFRGVCDQINMYCDKAWPRFRATLMRDYFKNPWTIVSTIAAVILLLVTVAQTTFTAFPSFAFHP